MQTKRSFATKATYWLKVVSLGLVLGLGVQFAQGWVAPGGAPPAGNVAGPITTGSSQTKAGALTTAGLAAPSFVDTDNVTRYVNPSGTSVLWGLSLTSLPNCDLKTNASGGVYCGTDATGAGGGVTSLSAGTGIVLSPNPITTTGTISADTSYMQRRVSASCPSGQSIRAINNDGSVMCETAGGGSWANINNVPTGAVAAGCNVFANVSSGTSSEECWGGASVTIGSCGSTLTQSNCPAGTTRRGNITSAWDSDHINCNRFGSFSCIKN